MKRTLIVTAVLVAWSSVAFAAADGTPPASTSSAAVSPVPAEPRLVLTPKPGPEPRLNGARVFGVRPGSPFLFTIAATGERPMTFGVAGLPEGLMLDTASGRITGSLAAPGDYEVTFTAANARGAASRPFKIVCGPALALTPHMGWNSWYVWENQVSDAIMRAVGGQSWRTAGDLGHDVVGNLFRDGFDVYSQNELHRYGGPGGWNDPDYLLVGILSSAFVADRKEGGNEASPLSPNEQYTHVSLWSLVAAPLIFSGDITRLDDFTLGLLTNDDIIDVDQDPLGRPGRRVAKTGDLEVWMREMEDGSKAVGLFNRGGTLATVTAKWDDLGLSGPQRVRDLWRSKELGVVDGAFEAYVARHGVVMIRLWPAAPAPAI